MTRGPQDKAVIALNGASKSYGAVRAIDCVDFQVMPGECLGLVGHNGAGKSTLVNVINGGVILDAGEISISGQSTDAYSIGIARAAGVRCVFQELSLCPNLTIAENAHVTHSDLKGWGWRVQAEDLLQEILDEIFPGHGIDCRNTVGALSIAQRQMVEIAMAFSHTDKPASLVILDEPTSSLDSSIAAQLLAYVRKFVNSGGAVVFISHILDEIIETADRIVVMKDGLIAVDKPANQFTTEGLVQAMGSVVSRSSQKHATARADNATPVIELPNLNLKAFPGEIIALAGLAGHGQTEALVRMYKSASGDWRSRRNISAAFVAGDRIVDGVLPLWSILRNLSISILPDLTRHFFVDSQKESQIGEAWKERIGIRTDDMDNPIFSLSGGNQQKVLFARALATTAPVVLMDDPMRGVDIGTKQDVYAMLRREAAAGRTFIWYSTEMDEVCQCDRVYVFRDGQISAELIGADVSEENVLAPSFQESAV